MKKLTALVAALAVAAILSASALAADPEVPFPAAKAGPVWVAAHTVTPGGAMASWFAPGDKVVFRAYAVETKSKKIIGKDQVQYFYVELKGQPNVKLAYNPNAPGASKGMPWTGTWTVPASYPAGIVDWRMLIKLKSKAKGQFVQMPVSTSQLNISTTAPTTLGSPAAGQSGLVGPATLAIYVDSVNGTAPAGTAPRPIGCTQTNIYHRGERVVIRSWGNVLSSGDILNNDTVQTASFTVPGVTTPVTMAWGAHGATGAKVWFWTNFWIVPADYPLGDATVTVTYKTFDGKTGQYLYPITIIP
jgi:hypothetical protein